MSSPGPPVPSYIFRGHATSIHALHFFRHNTLLASGDGEGWIVLWSLSTKRAVAVWRGHEGGIMCLKDWPDRGLISHGRDHRVRVWQLPTTDFEGGLDVRLPVDGAEADRSRQPWLVHSLPVNALNYCAFSTCVGDEEGLGAEGNDKDSFSNRSLLLAAPNGLDAGGVDVFHLPSERRVCKITSSKEIQTGMVMALGIFRAHEIKSLRLASGYESGHLLLSVRRDTDGQEWEWMTIMAIQPHTQPVLSLDIDPVGRYFFSSSADATIAKIDIEKGTVDRKVDTKHAGQQDLKARNDGKIFATAGWDKKVRVYSCKSLKELAVLKWHQEGCYATAFADILTQTDSPHVKPEEDALIKTAVDLLRKEQAKKVQGVHWLAAGGKDNKISLWDIY